MCMSVIIFLLYMSDLLRFDHEGVGGVQGLVTGNAFGAPCLEYCVVRV